MNKLSTLLLCAVLSAQAFCSKVHAIETELSAAHGYVETTDGKVGAAGINIPSEALNSSGLNPAKRNVLDLKNETCKNREKRNVLKISHTRHFKTTKKQSKTGCFYSCMLGTSIV